LLSGYILPRYGWRPLFLCAVVPGIVSLVMLRGVPDPPSWFAAKSKPRQTGTFATIMGTPSLRRNFLLWSVTAIALQFGYYGANTWLPSYLNDDLGINLQSQGFYVAATYTMGVVGKIITG